MKIRIFENENYNEPEVDIYYKELEPKVQHVIEYMKQYEYVLEGKKDESLYSISLEDIYYFEYVDGKTFIYDKDAVYESKKSLTSIEDEISGTSFVRISKSSIVNISCLNCFKPYPNHRLITELINGEKLVVSRKYIPEVKEKIRRLYNE